MERYRIVGAAPHTFMLAEHHDEVVDIYRTRSSAEHARKLLERGEARVNPHACLGCRVQLEGAQSCIR